MTTPSTPLAVAVIGFSEAGQAIGGGLAAAGAEVSAYDLRFDDDADGPALKARARALGVSAAASARAAAQGAHVVLSVVTPGAALAVAREAAGFLAPEQIFVDLNSVSPEDKRAGAATIAAAGASYVEAAVMSPVGPHGHRVPLLLGGEAAPRLAELLRPLGMRTDIAGPEIGRASAVKMCRSIVLKGLEALTVECLLTARAYGVEELVEASLEEAFAGFAWGQRSGYMLARAAAHGARRAEEMACAAATVRAAGLEPLMCEATARRQQWVADSGAGAVAGDPSDPAALAAARRTRT